MIIRNMRILTLLLYTLNCFSVDTTTKSAPTGMLGKMLNRIRGKSTSNNSALSQSPQNNAQGKSTPEDIGQDYEQPQSTHGDLSQSVQDTGQNKDKSKPIVTSPTRTAHTTHTQRRNNRQQARENKSNRSTQRNNNQREWVALLEARKKIAMEKVAKLKEHLIAYRDALSLNAQARSISISSTYFNTIIQCLDKAYGSISTIKSFLQDDLSSVQEQFNTILELIEQLFDTQYCAGNIRDMDTQKVVFARILFSLKIYSYGARLAPVFSRCLDYKTAMAKKDYHSIINDLNPRLVESEDNKKISNTQQRIQGLVQPESFPEISMDINPPSNIAAPAISQILEKIETILKITGQVSASNSDRLIKICGQDAIWTNNTTDTESITQIKGILLDQGVMTKDDEFLVIGLYKLGQMISKQK